jgi:hypothetical protein
MRSLCIFLFTFFLFSIKGFACDCQTIPVSLETIKPAELIFIGEVSAISGCDKTSKATFHVKELFRGKCFENTAIEFDCTSDCQMSFAPGQTWIIYATYKKYGEAEVQFCSYSRQQFAAEAEDFNTAVHGMSFTEEEAWLKKNLGVQQLNVKNTEAEQHHENIRPEGMQTLWYLVAGFLGLVLFYFIGRKFLK